MSTDSTAGDHRFQVDLRGLIDLLSNHLYSGPQVYLRELLQNGVDAIQARQRQGPGSSGEIRLEVLGVGEKTTLVFTDNGIGLTLEDAHRFLATIGQSSKRGDGVDRPEDFLGRFGIGLLSCFMVSDEIVVISQSAFAETRPVEWRGKADGTYSVRELDRAVPAGTQVFLRAKPSMLDFFDPDRVRSLVAHYGEFLPRPIVVSAGGQTGTINRPVPWADFDGRDAGQREALLAYGRETFETEFSDAIPLSSAAGGIDGAAFILARPTTVAARAAHRVYLKGMFLSDNVRDLFPEWAFFVRCIVNTRELRPTASRESFYEDRQLEAARDSLADGLRAHLVRLGRRDPERMQELISLHYIPIKMLCSEDDECLRLFADWLPFETSAGPMPLKEFRRENPVIRYTATVDQFRQVAPVAAAQGMGLINAGYTFDQAILERLAEALPGTVVERVDSQDMADRLDDVSLDEREASFRFMRLAEAVLQPMGCAADLKRFLPAELPALYAVDREGEFRRDVERVQEDADPVLGDVLGSLIEEDFASPARLYLNYSNPLVRRLAGLSDRETQRRALEILYVQALLLGHHPLRSREFRLLNDGLLACVQWAVEARGRARDENP